MNISVTYIASETPVPVTNKGRCLHNSTHWYCETPTIQEYEGEMAIAIEICNFCESWRDEEERDWNEA